MKVFIRTSNRCAKKVTTLAQKISDWWLSLAFIQMFIIAIFCAFGLSLILAFVHRALDSMVSEFFADLSMFSISTMTLLSFSALITSILKIKKMLEAISIKDHLTGAYNRRLLEETIVQVSAQAERHNEHTFFLFFDLNDLKRINDTHGHSVGDSALQIITTVTTNCLRVENRFFRIGGDEFFTTITLSKDDPKAMEKALALAKRISDKISEVVFFPGTTKIPLSISVGVHLFNSKNSIEDEIAIADKEMYEVKRKRKEGSEKK